MRRAGKGHGARQRLRYGSTSSPQAGGAAGTAYDLISCFLRDMAAHRLEYDPDAFERPSIPLQRLAPAAFAKATAAMEELTCRGHVVADHFMTVRGSRIKPVENGLHYRSLTVKSPRRHHKIFRYLPVPS